MINSCNKIVGDSGGFYSLDSLYNKFGRFFTNNLRTLVFEIYTHGYLNSFTKSKTINIYDQRKEFK